MVSATVALGFVALEGVFGVFFEKSNLNNCEAIYIVLFIF
ncbi:hypothetical protein SDC9_111005 [bioreactor metagenome]|uniref:Uncharacterized protein n=1 Tax=bioreactor metagenome TaxID=1076179 RepID=A0A645BF90_9ZZZZ